MEDFILINNQANSTKMIEVLKKFITSNFTSQTSGHIDLSNKDELIVSQLHLNEPLNFRGIQPILDKALHNSIENLNETLMDGISRLYKLEAFKCKQQIETLNIRDLKVYYETYYIIFNCYMKEISLN